MDNDLRKRLVIPFVVFIGLLAVNINNIVNGVRQHNNWRIGASVVSCVLIGAAFYLVIKSIRKSGKPPEV